MGGLEIAIDTFKEAAAALATVRKKYPGMIIEITSPAQNQFDKW